MKKLIAILLLLSFCIQLRGYQIYFQYRREKIREAVRSESRYNRNREQTVTFAFTKNEVAHIQWEKEDEFRYQGEMFDVLHQQVKDDTVILLCKKDEKERELVDNYFNFLKNDLPLAAKNKKSSWLIQLLNTYFSPTAFTQKLDFALVNPIHWVQITDPLFSRNTEVLTPPPKFSV